MDVREVLHPCSGGFLLRHGFYGGGGRDGPAGFWLCEGGGCRPPAVPDSPNNSEKWEPCHQHVPVPNEPVILGMGELLVLPVVFAGIISSSLLWCSTDPPAPGKPCVCGMEPREVFRMQRFMKSQPRFQTADSLSASLRTGNG